MLPWCVPTLTKKPRVPLAPDRAFDFCPSDKVSRRHNSMKMRMMLLLMIALFLAACSSSDAPSDEEAQEIIRGIWLRESTIVEKTKCELTPEMEGEGTTNVWLIEYRFEGKFDIDALTIAERDGDWVLFARNAFCPSELTTQ